MHAAMNWEMLSAIGQVVAAVGVINHREKSRANHVCGL